MKITTGPKPCTTNVWLITEAVKSSTWILWINWAVIVIAAQLFFPDSQSYLQIGVPASEVHVTVHFFRLVRLLRRFFWPIAILGFGVWSIRATSYVPVWIATPYYIGTAFKKFIPLNVQCNYRYNRYLWCRKVFTQKKERKRERYT